ncbi:MAG: phospholipid carrier-dependent glycosyltransferase [Thermoleophilaceae bacterium]|nr:phospholipid carrier-dependent glycosyltransferase [Thermoleophilaceae bacterium]
MGLLLAAALAVRLWNIDYGLPYVWSVDEARHFTEPAVLMFERGFDPGYYHNPALFTYLINRVLWLIYGPLGLRLDARFDGVNVQFHKDASDIFLTARILAAMLGTAAVAALYLVARRLWGVREGLVAAAMLTFAFLPVSISRVAVSDVGALIGVSLAIFGAVRIYEGGGRRWFLLTGLAIGVALAFKYTTGLLVIPLLIAAATRLKRDGPAVLGYLAAGLGAAAAIVLLSNPYLVLNADEAWGALQDQAGVAARQEKPGQGSGGFSFYLDSLTWGFGWLALSAALAGAVLLGLRDRMRLLLVASFPVALLIYLALQARFFGRWLLPAYPALAILAALAVGRLADALPRRALVQAGAVLLLTGGLLAQSLAADVRTARVIARKDTRVQARDFLVGRYPPQMRISIEPDVSGRYYRLTPGGEAVPPTVRRGCPGRPGSWYVRTVGGGWRCKLHKPGQFSRPDGSARASAWHYFISPAVIDQYRRNGYCHVVTFSTVRSRVATSRPERVRSRALAYYRRLEREADVIGRYSPYDPGRDPVPLDFDLTFNYYPTAYDRPGPEVTIYRLRRCTQGYGEPPEHLPRHPQLPNLGRDEL